MAVLFQVAVVTGDPGRGELVERVMTELRAEVVADDLLVPGDRGVRELEAFRPGVGVDTECGHLAAELLVLVALFECVLQRGVRVGGCGEPAPAELLLPEVRGAETGPVEEPLDEGAADIRKRDGSISLQDTPEVLRLRALLSEDRSDEEFEVSLEVLLDRLAAELTQ